ncbi:glycoside hydrolase family 16 protein [Mycolicibacterium moriokaense]|uniref:glycoside hydrolase family 16 protein n=1 Tax=Mycolicibacterium moriokaense TaxID=39691 RepID=UPI001F19C9EE|nr:glycoside hydrolase family 16 protein [Mycolicibacterium moriokaense]
MAVATMLGQRYFEQRRTSELFSTQGLTLRSEETFDGPAGAPPNPARFDYDLGGGGWGNGEQQFYTRNPENVRLSGSGQLMIEAWRNGGTFTSARVVTRAKLDVQRGLLEARIKMPAGPGIHPAFWLLGENIPSVGWPACGEIDIIELVNSGHDFHNAIHGPMVNDPTAPWKQSNDGPAAQDLTTDFHTYQVLRQPGVIKIGIDGGLVGEYRAASAPPDTRWVFDGPMYITLNVAVGGEWPGPVHASTPFPATMLVDWIRYWQ